MPSGQSKSVTTQELSKQQKALLDPVIPIAKDYLNQDIQMAPPIHGGPPMNVRHALNDAKHRVLPQLKGMSDQGQGTAGTVMGGAGAGTGGAAQLMQTGAAGTGSMGDLASVVPGSAEANKFLSSGALLDPRTNPTLQGQIEATTRPLIERLKHDMLPAIKSDFVGGNMMGSSRQGIAEGRAIGETSDAMSDAVSKLVSNNFNQGLGAMLNASSTGLGTGSTQVGQSLGALGTGAQTLTGNALSAMGQLPQLGELALLAPRTQEAIGQTWEGYRERQRQEEAQRFNTQQVMPFLKAQDVANLAFGFNNGTATSTTSQPVNPLQMLFGGMSLFGGI